MAARARKENCNVAPVSEGSARQRVAAHQNLFRDRTELWFTLCDGHFWLWINTYVSLIAAEKSSSWHPCGAGFSCWLVLCRE